MQTKDLINVPIESLLPEASEFCFKDHKNLGIIATRKATLRDEIYFKKLYGENLAELQRAMLNSDMQIVCQAFWHLLTKDSKEKFRRIKVVDENEETLTINDLEDEYHILFFLAFGPYDKSLICHAVGKSFAGEKSLEEIPDEELKKKLIKDLRLKKN